MLTEEEKYFWYCKGYNGFLVDQRFAPPSTATKEQTIAWFQGWDDAVRFTILDERVK